MLSGASHLPRLHEPTMLPIRPRIGATPLGADGTVGGPLGIALQRPEGTLPSGRMGTICGGKGPGEATHILLGPE